MSKGGCQGLAKKVQNGLADGDSKPFHLVVGRFSNNRGEMAVAKTAR